jgi:lauroyl/myristoyl acyltransferase
VLGRFHVTGVFWFRFHEWMVRTVPSWATPTIIVVFTTFFFVVLRNIRRAVASNLVPVLGECGFWERQRRIYRTMYQFAWCLTERYERLGGSDRFVIEIDKREPWNELLRSTHGFVLVTGHVGNWEVGASDAALQHGRHVHLVRAQELDSRAQEFIQQLLRERLGEFVTTHFASGDVSLGITLLEALREGHLVALQGDRPRAGSRTVEVTLFDKPYELPVGPFALARAAAVPLLPVFVLREARFRYRTVFCEPIRVAVTPDRDADVRAAAREMAQAIAWAIGREPHQWFCFRDLWGERRHRSLHTDP